MSKPMSKQDAIETLEIFRNDYTREGSAIYRAIDIAIDALRQPTIKPEVHYGRWIIDKGDMWCSECGYEDVTENGEPEDYHYCPHCGTEMDGGAENA